MPVGKDPKTLYKKDIEDIETIWVKGNLQHVNLSQGINDFAFNDIYFINESNLYYNKILFNEISFIKEDLDLFNWQILGDTKTILNYKCKKAVSSFRGRLYEAYFTEELKSKGGPWKFHGLPGTILSVRSVDDYFSIVAKSVNIQDNSEIKNPIIDNKFISLETYKEKLRQKHLKTLRAFKSKQPTNTEGGGTIEIKFNDDIEDLGLETIKFSY